MTTKFSAGHIYMGYLYQSRFALYLLLEKEEEAEIELESLDDIVFEDKGFPKELLQLKHHVNNKISLTNSSVDLWKTIRIWSTYLKEEKIFLPRTVLTLITTSEAPNDSIASLLRFDNRKPEEACKKLIQIAETSHNNTLKTDFEIFLSLSQQQRNILVDSIFILDSSPNIFDIVNEIKKKIQYAVYKEHLNQLYERLEGWWSGKVIQHLKGDSKETIKRIDVHNKIIDIGQQFRPEALPIDYFDSKPTTKTDLKKDIRTFVLQLKEIALHSKRIENAILDYYRAFKQRSRWVRDELIFSSELEQYEKRLVDEWERYFLALKEECHALEKNELEMQKIGKKTYNWMELEANIPIRKEVTEPYVMRGSYHMLADENPPRVYWHTKFLERLQILLTNK